MAEVKKVWNADGNALYLGYPSQEFEELENVIYKVSLDMFERPFLAKVADNFTFDYKLYGLETDFINRVLKTYNATDNGNLGILLNGLKGTGKTVSSKQIANQLNQPIIIVGENKPQYPSFLNGIPQNITIFIDEYEKTFGNASNMLTIMDGASNSDYRRVFLLTTNELRVESNMIQRPGRVRYLKTFDHLKPAVIKEIVDDILVHKQFTNDCIQFISSLETITVDIVKAVLNEVNIHEEAPTAFETIFNVKKLKGKYNVSIREEDGTLTEIASNIAVNPRPMFNESYVGYELEVDGVTVGEIVRVVNYNTIEVEPYELEDGSPIGFKENIMVKIEDADLINYAYAYDGFGSTQVSRPKKKSSDFLKKISKEWDDYENKRRNGNTKPSLDFAKISQPFSDAENEVMSEESMGG
jgi:SpoVK/Ycf46/Vps4 family AAA+-type ATPase